MMFPGAPSSNRDRAIDTVGQGLDLLEQGDEAEAGRYFFKSVEIDPTYADGYNHLANIVWRKGDWKQAEDLYRKALGCAGITALYASSMRSRAYSLEARQT